MKNKLFIALFIALVSCHSKQGEVERVEGIPEIILNDLETMMPGELGLTKDYILWANPFTTENFVHIVDRETGIEIGQAISIGSGPEELVQPSLSTYYPENALFAYNANSRKQFEIRITEEGDLLQEQVVLNYGEGSFITRMVPLGNSQYLVFDPKIDKPFTVLGTKDSYSFGKLPYEGDIANRYDVFQGSIKFNSLRDVFVYAPFSFPYISMYKRQNGEFILDKEVLFSSNFQIIDGELKGDVSQKNISDLALTQDYIVALQRDYSTDHTDESTVGRDFEKLPQTIFLYNYDLELIRIIHLGIPLLRLAGDPSNNTVYLIGLSPDFAIAKLEI
ncbi:hypothetical protein [Parabacteroides sp. PF5-6]|uniref:hypothetical protein n=1 Tax=Parabacteroides sp. PF5-6 TaxID=1742403 RepID=UPI0024068564|nr:hypothetical protein [Parabacteroides sp. PF5-6]MDF9831304.1 hypothetical protein [Parabacteroides sp. PF5-6]